MSNRKYTFIDLFAGCGGLSEGFYRVGFKALAHVEINHWACETLRARMYYYGYKLHAVCSLRGVFQSVDLTPTNVHDVH